MSADRVGFRCSMCGKLHKTQRDRDECEARFKDEALVERPRVDRMASRVQEFNAEYGG